MKKIFLLFVAFLFIALAANAQDIITMTDGTKVRAKVLEINPGDIKYKEFSNIDGPTITVEKSGVSTIQYANGQKTVINKEASTYNSSGNYKRPGNDHHGYKKTSDKNARLKGWYFGVGLNLGLSNATSTDPTYSTSGSIYSAGNFYATKMFNQHIGIQFGIGSETYSYMLTYNYTSQYYGYYDVYSLSCLTIPVRAIYISNSKKRVGIYAMAGFDCSIVATAKDEEGDNISSSYNTLMFSPFVSCGVAFRNKNARYVWMFGPYYKTTLSNVYSDEAGNTGTANSAGISVEFMGKFGRGR